jgi:pSer/pThr/pTyr-binding forkhead associated (FHA) protein
MVQLKVLSGKKAGTVWMARRFPVRIGRAAAADLQLDESGVWDQHLQLDLSPGEGFVLSAQPNALASVNGQAVHQALLRNGDAIDVGSVKMQFWLGETRQGGLRFREGLTWAGIAIVTLGQVGLIYWLLR